MIGEETTAGTEEAVLEVVIRPRTDPFLLETRPETAENPLETEAILDLDMDTLMIEATLEIEAADQEITLEVVESTPQTEETHTTRGTTPETEDILLTGMMTKEVIPVKDISPDTGQETNLEAKQKTSRAY
jgi:hypothetical protein